MRGGRVRHAFVLRGFLFPVRNFKIIRKARAAPILWTRAALATNLLPPAGGSRSPLIAPRQPAGVVRKQGVEHRRPWVPLRFSLGWRGLSFVFFARGERPRRASRPASARLPRPTEPEPG